jgi:hypothetical protein
MTQRPLGMRLAVVFAMLLAMWFGWSRFGPQKPPRLLLAALSSSTCDNAFSISLGMPTCGRISRPVARRSAFSTYASRGLAIATSRWFASRRSGYTLLATKKSLSKPSTSGSTEG